MQFAPVAAQFISHRYAEQCLHFYQNNPAKLSNYVVHIISQFFYKNHPQN